MAINQELIVRIGSDITEFEKGIQEATKVTKDLEAGLQRLSKISGIAFAGLTAEIALSTKAFIDYETALVGVGKTTGTTGEELDQLGKEISDLSKEIPVATTELLGIAQAAGQLGVKGKDNLVKFTETVAKLGTASDLAGEEAAQTLTRILNVSGQGVENIDRFASSIVALGNNFAATESQIARSTNEVARATAIYKLGAEESAALGTALASLGIRAEAGGTAVGRAFGAIDKALRTGGTQLDKLIKLTGKTEKELKDTFQKNSVKVFQDFIKGLQRVRKEGGSVVEQLEEFDLKGQEIVKTLPVLAERADLVAEAIGTSTKAFEENNALSEEAKAAYDTLGSRIQIFQNILNDIQTQIGSTFAPLLTVAVEGLTAVARVFSESGFAKAAAIFVGISAALTGLVTAVGLASIAFTKFNVVLNAAQVANINLARSFRILLGATGIGLALSVLPVIIDLFKKAGQTVEDTSNKIEGGFDSDNKKIEEQGKLLEDNNRKIALRKKQLENLQKQQGRSFGIRTGGGAISEEDINRTKKSIKALEEQQEAIQKNIDIAQARIDKAEEEKKKQEELDKKLRESLKNRSKAEKDFLTQLKDRINESNKLRANQVKNAETVADAEVVIARNQLEGLKAINKARVANVKETAAIERETKISNLELQIEEQKAIMEIFNEENLEFEEEQRALELEAIAEHNEMILQAHRDRDKQFFRDREQFGLTTAKLRRFLNQQEVNDTEAISGKLAKLASSRNKTLSTIGKIGAITSMN